MPENEQVRPSAPLPRGTVLDLAGVSFLSGSLLAGGSPWRLVRLNERARSTVDGWRAGGRLASGSALARALVDRGLARPRWPPDWDRDAIDVIVPVHDDVETFAPLLAALGDYAVTVVDDGSRDPSAVARCAEEFGARLVRLEVNRGPGGARNAGARATTRPWLWFIDADVVLDDAVALGARLLASGNDPRVGAVAPRVRGVGGRGPRARFERAHGPLDLGPTGGLVAPQTARSYVPSACLLVRRDAFVGGFDETLRVGEDVDLVWRLSDAGWLVRYDADLVVGHLARATWRAWWRQRLTYGTSAAALGVRHGARLAPVVVDETVAPVFAGLLTGRLGLAGASTMALARRIDRELTRDLERRGALVARLCARAVLGGAGATSRSLVRSYGPVLVAAALVPRLRRRVGLVIAIGTLWRWRGRGGFDPRDVPLAIADDLAYGLGVWLGAWRQRDATALTPVVAATSSR